MLHSLIHPTFPLTHPLCTPSSSSCSSSSTHMQLPLSAPASIAERGSHRDCALPSLPPSSTSSLFFSHHTERGGEAEHFSFRERSTSIRSLSRRSTSMASSFSSSPSASSHPLLPYDSRFLTAPCASSSKFTPVLRRAGLQLTQMQTEIRSSPLVASSCAYTGRSGVSGSSRKQGIARGVGGGGGGGREIVDMEDLADKLVRKVWPNLVEREEEEDAIPSLRPLSPYQSFKVFVLTLLYIAILFLGLRAVFAVALNPVVLTYAMFLLVIWPWPTAIGLGLGALIVALKRGGSTEDGSRGGKMWEQVLLLGGALTWLTLVPCGALQGHVDGWATALFVFYCIFYSISSIIRLKIHDDLSSPEPERLTSTPISPAAQTVFILAVVGLHWVAAWESPMVKAPSFFKDCLARVFMFLAVWLHWDSAWFLFKGLDRHAVPTSVVTTGPYRFARHPIYGSYILCFSSFCLALRSYKSFVFLLATCLAYFSYRIMLEEELLVQTFGSEYEDYRKRVTKKFFAFLF